MAGFQHSKNSVFKLDIPSGSSNHLLTLQNISPYVTNVDGLPGELEQADITALGDGGRRFFNDVMQNSQITLSMMWNSDKSSSGEGGPFALEEWFGDLSTAATSTLSRSFEYSPDSTTSGKRKFTGECLIASLTEVSAVGELVLMSATLQVDGVVTIGTH